MLFDSSRPEVRTLTYGNGEWGKRASGGSVCRYLHLAVLTEAAVHGGERQVRPRRQVRRERLQRGEAPRALQRQRLFVRR